MYYRGNSKPSLSLRISCLECDPKNYLLCLVGSLSKLKRHQVNRGFTWMYQIARVNWTGHLMFVEPKWLNVNFLLLEHTILSFGAPESICVVVCIHFVHPNTHIFPAENGEWMYDFSKRANSAPVLIKSSKWYALYSTQFEQMRMLKKQYITWCCSLSNFGHVIVSLTLYHSFPFVLEWKHASEIPVFSASIAADSIAGEYFISIKWIFNEIYTLLHIIKPNEPKEKSHCLFSHSRTLSLYRIEIL